ncbi:MAG: FGGY-family carbohydrate kinase [Candidatus Velthaea sp.]
MTGDLLLAIDVGTQSARALLFDARGELIAKARVPLDDYVTLQPGWHEHDVEGFWTAACQACNALWASDPALRARVAGVAVTTQRGTVVNLDRAGRPLRRAITWLDQRKSPRIPPIPLKWRAAFRLAGVGATVRYFQREAEANWISACEPAIWANTDKFLLLSGYLLYRLTGRFIDSAGAQVGYFPFDFKALGWAKPGDWRWNALPLVPAMLAELVEPGTPAGEILDEAAAALGIARKTPVAVAAADKACEVLGSGCLEPSIGALSYGTTATINTVSQRYLEAQPFVPPYPAAIPHAYNTEVQIFRGYWMVSWFKEQFGHLEQSASEASGRPVEAYFDELVESVPPGSMGLVLQPYWTPGIRMPEARGAIIGFSDAHTRAHIYRAILEGLAFALREGMQRIEKRSRVAVTSLRVAGGGSQSDAALQLTADVFGLPAARPHVYETSGLGAAIDAAVALGIHPNFASAVREMTRTSRTFEPNPNVHALYDDLYRSVYLPMYPRLHPLYTALRRITGAGTAGAS